MFPQPRPSIMLLHHFSYLMPPLSFMRFLFLGVSWSSFWSWRWVLRDSCRSHTGEESHLLLFFKFSIHLNNTCFSVTLKFCCLLNKSAADSVKAAPFDLFCFVWASLFLLSWRFPGRLGFTELCSCINIEAANFSLFKPLNSPHSCFLIDVNLFELKRSN